MLKILLQIDISYFTKQITFNRIVCYRNIYFQRLILHVFVVVVFIQVFDN